jgi:hypothetical protein
MLRKGGARLARWPRVHEGAGRSAGWIAAQSRSMRDQPAKYQAAERLP